MVAYCCVQMNRCFWEAIAYSIHIAQCTSGPLSWSDGTDVEGVGGLGSATIED